MAYGMIRFMQKLLKAKNISNGIEEKTEHKNGRVYYRDISYDSHFPNHFMDIYLADEEISTVRPTLFYVHGGGYTWGDKFTDGNKEGFEWMFEAYLKSGYNVVSINYAFAPDYPYPIPVLQIGEAVRFLQKHPELGISMEEVVFAGSSAGGQLVGQFVNIQTNPAYSDRIGIGPVLGKEHIKAVVFYSSLFDMERFGEVDSRSASRTLIRCGEAYFQIPGKWPNSPGIQEAQVTANLCADFPPCFISDGNVNSFTSQAREMDAKCTELGIVHEINLVPVEEAKLTHGYEDYGTKYGKKNLKKTLAFLRRL